MEKTFVKVNTEDVREFWICVNDNCDKHNHQLYVSPDFYSRSGTPICECCGDDLGFDHVEVAT